MIRKILLINFVLILISFPQDSFYKETLKVWRIEGYAFIDHQQTGIMQIDSDIIVNARIQLWKGNDLVDVTQTDENGYYEFSNLSILSAYSLQVEELENYHYSSQERIKVTYHESLSDDEVVNQYNIAYNEKSYLITYELNGGYDYEQYQTSFHRDDLVILPSHVKKEGYLFVGWSRKQGDDEVVYQPTETFMMPPCGITLYASFKKINANNKTTSSYSQPIEEKQVYQKIDSGFIISMMLLLIIGIRIVYQSLREKKNR